MVVADRHFITSRFSCYALRPLNAADNVDSITALVGARTTCTCWSSLAPQAKQPSPLAFSSARSTLTNNTLTTLFDRTGSQAPPPFFTILSLGFAWRLLHSQRRIISIPEHYFHRHQSRVSWSLDHSPLLPSCPIAAGGYFWRVVDLI